MGGTCKKLSKWPHVGLAYYFFCMVLLRTLLTLIGWRGYFSKWISITPPSKVSYASYKLFHCSLLDIYYFFFVLEMTALDAVL